MQTNLFPVTVVGSWSRPQWLIQALRKRQRGELSPSEFNEIANDAVLAAAKYQEDAGVDIITDGEQRRDNFYSFVVEKLEGMKLMSVADLLDFVKDRARFEETLRALDVPAFAIKSPVAVDEVKPRDHLALDEFLFLKEHTKKPIKVTLPGPYLLSRSSWFEGLSDKFYRTREDLAQTLTKILRDEIIALKEAGAHFIQLDEPVLTQVVYGAESEETFMCAALSSRRDPSDELDLAVDLMNKTVQGISGVKLGVHVCRGNWSKREDVLLKGDYAPLLPYLISMKINQLVLEFATPRAGEMKVFSEYKNEKEMGLGVVNPRSDEVESPEKITKKVEAALQYFDNNMLYLNPDCGFGTFAERSVNSPRVAYEKLKSIGLAAQTLRRHYA